MLFISDGDDLGSDPSAAATALKTNGAYLLVAGAGTAQGAHVPVTDATTGEVTDKVGADGTPVVTHLSEPFLQALAGAAGGRYIGNDLSVVPGITQARLQSLQSAVLSVRNTTIPIERYQWFAGAALVLLVLASFAEYLHAALPRRAGVLALFAVMGLAVSGCATRAHDATEEGMTALERGDASRAVELFQEAAQGHSDDPRTATNLAAALYAAQRYEEAILAARRALPSNDAATRGHAWASIGHSQFAAGRLPDSLEAFKHALLENPSDSASRHDYEVVFALLHPEQRPDQQPSDHATPTPAQTPAGTASPEPGDGSPQGSPTPGSPTPGAVEGSATPGASASVEARGDSAVQEQLREIDRQIEQILSAAGGNPNPEQALQILKLLADRSRIAQLRDPSGVHSGPNDY